MSIRRDDLPPDVLDQDGFRDVLAKFYAESNMDALWREYQPRYQEGAAQLRDPLQRVRCELWANIGPLAQPETTESLTAAWEEGARALSWGKP